MRWWIVVPFLMAVGAGSMALHELRAPRAAQAPIAARATTFSPDAPVAAVAPTAPATRLPRTEVRSQVRSVIERDRPRVQTVASLDGYLSDLERAARANHRVTALEVQPGVAAIAALAEELDPQRTIERQMEFARQMQVLSAELDGRSL